jgi:hypothetical protein
MRPCGSAHVFVAARMRVYRYVSAYRDEREIRARVRMGFKGVKYFFKEIINIWIKITHYFGTEGLRVQSIGVRFHL